MQDPRVDPSAENNFAIRWAENDRRKIVKLLLTDSRVREKFKNNNKWKHVLTEYGYD